MSADPQSITDGRDKNVVTIYPTISVLVSGAVGGAFNPLLKIGLAFTGQSTTEPNLQASYAAGIFIMAAIGAAVVWIFKETDTRKAFALAAGLPALALAVHSDIQQSSKKPLNINNLSPISSAFGQESFSPPPAPTVLSNYSQPSRQRSLIAKSLNEDTQIAITFLNDAHETIAPTCLLPPNGSLQIPIPDVAQSVKFTVGNYPSSPLYTLGAGAGTITIFEVKSTAQSDYGLLTALGDAPKTKIVFSVKASVQSPPTPTGPTIPFDRPHRVNRSLVGGILNVRQGPGSDQPVKYQLDSTAANIRLTGDWHYNGSDLWVAITCNVAANGDLPLPLDPIGHALFKAITDASQNSQTINGWVNYRYLVSQ